MNPSLSVLLIDNYDSFTYNLVDYLFRCGAHCRIIRNDQLTLKEIKGIPFDAIVLSPGPGRPEDAGVMMDLIDRYHKSVPILGICLGHQALGAYFGGQVVHAAQPMHGKKCRVRHDHSYLFLDIPSPFEAMRYHSLIVAPPVPEMIVIAESEAEEIMALRHPEWPATGVQFHPESILTSPGLKLTGNWLKHVRGILSS